MFWTCGSTKHLKVNCPANRAHQGNPKLRAAMEVASESEVENTEADPDNTTEVKGEAGSASEVSEEEADANGVSLQRDSCDEVFSVVSENAENWRTKRGVGICSTVEPLAFFGLRCRRRNINIRIVRVETGHGEGDPEEGQQSNSDHQHSSSGDSAFGQLVQRVFLVKWDPIVGLR